MSVDYLNHFVQLNHGLTSLSLDLIPIPSRYNIQASVNSTPKEKQRKQERQEDPDEPKRNEKRQKGGNSIFLAPLPLSDALVKFLGTGENTLPQCDVVKRIWDYIKQNDLQKASSANVENRQVPGSDLLPFTPLSIEDDAIRGHKDNNVSEDM
ncbi:SWIB complex BAF60b domain-containing protein [Forsythia ovata]|uniref:SWIB complex BAF60b domain-containing protein n=1 Tax=Forsythia ovata TaxID=205694 RepID=A0ABD1T7W7_9LAMI